MSACSNQADRTLALMKQDGVLPGENGNELNIPLYRKKDWRTILNLNLFLLPPSSLRAPTTSRPPHPSIAQQMASITKKCQSKLVSQFEIFKTSRAYKN
jgi:hypothetical protein